jgi:hypothetical protein
MQTKGFPGTTVTGKNPRHSRSRVFAALLSVSLTLLFNTACTTTKPAPQATNDTPVKYIVIADSTSFFKYGPAQASGPDLNLKKNQIITMVEKHYGYSRVLSPDGDAGYVGTDDIAPAPSQLAAASTPEPKRSSRVGGSHGGGAPDFDQPNDSALPSKQQPSDVPVPSFRY